MASTPLGDISGARFHAPAVVQNATVASGGANALIGVAGPFEHPIRVRGAYWIPTGGANSATQTATYRRLSVVNLGTGGAGTAVVASLNLTASLASLVGRALTVDTTATVAAGEVLAVSQATVGGTDANGTVLQAGSFALNYEVI